MSILPGTASGTSAAAQGVPAINQAFEPAWVRHGSAATQKAYESALTFEQALVEQLSRSLAATGGLDGESGESGSEEGGSSAGGAGASELSSMLPQSLTAGIMNAGGLGMAAQMTRELEGVHATPQAHANGGTGAS